MYSMYKAHSSTVYAMIYICQKEVNNGIPYIFYDVFFSV